MKKRKLILVLALTALAALLLAACSPMVPAPNGAEDGATMITPVNGDDGEGAIAGADAKTIEILGALGYTGLVETAPITLADGAAVYTDPASGDELHVRKGVATTGKAKCQIAGIALTGNVERLSMGHQRHRIGRFQPRAAEVQRLVRAGDVGNGDVEHRPRAPADPAQQ